MSCLSLYIFTSMASAGFSFIVSSLHVVFILSKNLVLLYFKKCVKYYLHCVRGLRQNLETNFKD